MKDTWLVLGFTCDDIVCAGQDARLASECVRAWQAAGCPADFRILHGSGQGEHVACWFVNPAAARALDAHGVEWRTRVVAAVLEPPVTAKDALGWRTS